MFQLLGLGWALRDGALGHSQTALAPSLLPRRPKAWPQDAASREGVQGLPEARLSSQLSNCLKTS